MDNRQKLPFRVTLLGRRTPQGSSPVGCSTLSASRDASRTPDYLVSKESTDAAGQDRQAGTIPDVQGTSECVSPRQQRKTSSFLGFRPPSVLNIRERRMSLCSRSVSPPRVCPTEDLPPTKGVEGVSWLSPTAVKLEESVYHTRSMSSLPTSPHSSLMASQAMPTAAQNSSQTRPKTAKVITPDFSSQSAVTANAPTATAAGVDKGTGGSAESKGNQSSVYNVCSLCGVTVILAGTHEDQQQQWRDHINSWMHQRCLKMHKNTRGRTERVRVDDYATSSISSPVSPSMLRALEEFSSSLASTDTVSFEERAADSPSRLPRYGNYGRMDAVMSRKTDDRAFLPTGFDSGVAGNSTSQRSPLEKELFSSIQQPCTVDRRDAAAGVTTEKRQDEALPTTPCDGNLQMRGRAAATLAQEANPRGLTRKGGKMAVNQREAQRADSEIAMISIVEKTERDRRRLRSEKKKRMQFVFDRYVVDRRRRMLLSCIRHWFNAMFVRVTNRFLRQNWESPRAPCATPSAMASLTAPEDARSPEKSDGKKRFKTLSREVLTKCDKATTTKDSCANRSDAKQDVLFMASCVKDYAHISDDRSVDSVEMEVGKTDVKWYVCREAGRGQPLKRKSSRRRRKSRSTTPSWEEDSSVEELLATLAVPLQKRVRMVLSGQSAAKSKFPQTSEVISGMRRSLNEELQHLSNHHQCHYPCYNHHRCQPQRQHHYYHYPLQHAPLNSSNRVPEGSGYFQQPASGRQQNHVNDGGISEELRQFRGGEEVCRPPVRESAAASSSQGKFFSQSVSGEPTMGAAAAADEAAYSNEGRRGGKLPNLCAETSPEATSAQSPQSVIEPDGSTQPKRHKRCSSEGRASVDENGRDIVPLNLCEPLVGQELEYSVEKTFCKDQCTYWSPQRQQRGESGNETLEKKVKEPLDQELRMKVSQNENTGLSCGETVVSSSSPPHSSMTVGDNGDPVASLQGIRKNGGTVNPRLISASGCPSKGNPAMACQNFKGIPGEYYCYHDGAYYHVRDPAADAYCDRWGRRLPLYFVRRPDTSAMSPTRMVYPAATPTRSRSPLGPRRLNPYCSTCVQRYNIVMVDEYMRSVTPTVNERSEGGSCTCGLTGRRSSASGRMGRQTPLRASNRVTPRHVRRPG
ncbi:unnamed protein product, partial [Trypanosoma congolense IL3000]